MEEAVPRTRSGIPRRHPHQADAAPIAHLYHCLIIDTKLYSKLHEVAEGLRYLHSYGVVHGDLKGASPYQLFLGPAFHSIQCLKPSEPDRMLIL